MAKVVGGVGISHTPSMGVEYDRGMAEGFDPRWRLWFDGARPAKEWIANLAPDHVVIFYNDHLNHFSFDAYPTLAIGVAEEFRQADEGWGLRPFPSLAGDTEFGWSLTEKLIHGGFDLTVCQDLAVDHGVYSWLPYLADVSKSGAWPWPVTPIAANLIRHPLPTARRFQQLGAAVRAAVEAYPGDERVLVIATGGMSHQISGARFGIANEGLDRWFIRELETNAETLIATPQEDYMRFGGVEAAELSIWFAMRAALSNDIARIYDYHTVPQITGCGVVVFEELG